MESKRLDIFAIMKKTHAFPKRLGIFEEFMSQENSLYKEEDKKFTQLSENQRKVSGNDDTILPEASD